jgi:hypothetical protein
MKVTYTADDGSVFDSEDECKAYEEEQIRPCLVILELMTFYDEKGKQLPKAYDDPTQQLEYCYQNGYFVTVARDLTEDEVRYIDHETGFNLPNVKGRFRWDESNEQWLSYLDEWEQFLRRWEPLDTFIS